MRPSMLFTAVLATLSVANTAYADEQKVLVEELKEAKTPYTPEEKADKSDWTATGNVGFVSDYYSRGISQTWHKPTVQGGMDITHSSGFYAGVWGSGVTPNTYPDATTEIDVYTGYNGSIPWVEGMGWTVGLYGYLYPGGSWKKYKFTGYTDANGNLVRQTPNGGDWNSLEANFGLSYDWFSVKASYMLTNWFGADRSTGWTKSTRGTVYLEANANYPLPWWDLTLVGHVGRLMVNGRLNTDYTTGNAYDFTTNTLTLPVQPSATTARTTPNYFDWKVGLSKAFKIAQADGFNAGVYVVGSSNHSYWSSHGYGGSSFNGGPTSDFKNLYDTRLVLTVGRTF